MNSFTRIKGELQPLLEHFSDDNLDSIEDACLKYLLNTSLTDAASARRNTGLYLILKLAGQIRELLDNSPMMDDRFEAIKAGAWEPFSKFANTVLADPDAESMLIAFQEAL